MAADLGQHALFQGQLLRNVLLDEIRPLRHHLEIGRERQRALGRQRRARQPRERRLGVRDGAAYPLLHFGLHVGGDDVDAEVQRARGPSAPDDSGSQ
jgi:hypothetical protein